MKLDEYLRENYSASSTGSYLNTIGHYLAYMGDRAEKATHGEVMEYIGHLRSRNLHPKSVRNHLHGIKIYHSYLQAAGKREDHPCKHLRLKDRVDKQIHTESLYSREELREYYDGFPEGKEKIIAGLLVFQALTVQEISGLRTNDMDLEKGTVSVKAGAQNNGRTLPLKPEQILPLSRHISSLRTETNESTETTELTQSTETSKPQTSKPQTSEPFLITNARGGRQAAGDINRQLNKGREKKLTPQKIRQSVIAHLLKEHHDIRIVQTFAGHRRASSTEAYKQSGLDELKAAIGKLHPLQ